MTEHAYEPHPVNLDYLAFLLHDLARGLLEGLSRYAGQPCRVAVIYAIGHNDPLRVFDPYGLLAGERQAIAEHYRGPTWCRGGPRGELPHLEPPEVLSYGWSTRQVYHQRWFVDRPADVADLRPIERWLYYASTSLTEFVVSELNNLHQMISRAHLRALEGFAETAVHGAIVHISQERGVEVSVSPLQRFLGAVRRLTIQREEGRRASGSLAYVEPALQAAVSWDLHLAIEEQPPVANIKHVAKILFSIPRSQNAVVVRDRLVGLARSVPGAIMRVDFSSPRARILVGPDEHLVAYCQSGEYLGAGLGAAALEHGLRALDRPQPTIDLVCGIARSAVSQLHGCTILLAPATEQLSGHHLAAPISLTMPESRELAASLGRIDGALHVDQSGLLQAFGCLLDGQRQPNEDRARGARFNSALRYTAEHAEAVVVVVSEDGPITLFAGGEARLRYVDPPPPDRVDPGPLLEEWLGANPQPGPTTSS